MSFALSGIIQDEKTTTTTTHSCGGNLSQILSQRITSKVKKVNESVSKRINKLKTDLDKRLSDGLAQMVDKRVNSEMNKIRTEVDSRMSNIRSDLTSEIEETEAKVNSITVTLQVDVGASESHNRHLNVVVRNFPESVNENIEDRMNSLLRIHIKVVDVTVSVAKRIESNSDSKPWVITATFRSSEDKEKMMKSKNKLKNSVYKQVFIHNDQSKEERLLNSNLRAIVDAVTCIHNNTNLSVRGNRVVRNNNNGEREGQNIGNRTDVDRGENENQNTQNSPNRNGHSRGRGFGRGYRNFRGGNHGSRGGRNDSRGSNNGPWSGNNGSRGGNNGNCDSILWLQLKHRYLDLCIFACVCYLPPNRSSRQVDAHDFLIHY